MNRLLGWLADYSGVILILAVVIWMAFVFIWAAEDSSSYDRAFAECLKQGHKDFECASMIRGDPHRINP